eukprot:8389080-Alexandrium_andersonii.AAC.1
MSDTGASGSFTVRDGDAAAVLRRVRAKISESATGQPTDAEFELEEDSGAGSCLASRRRGPRTLLELHEYFPRVLDTVQECNLHQTLIRNFELGIFLRTHYSGIDCPGYVLRSLETAANAKGWLSPSAQ